MIERDARLRLKFEGILNPLSLRFRSSVAEAPVTLISADLCYIPVVDSRRFGSSSDEN